MFERLAEFFLPPQRSTTAAEVDALFHFIHIVGFILFVGIVSAIVYFAIKYRRQSEDEVTPVITHNTKLEITWSVIPTILILIVFSWGFRGFLTVNTAPSDAYEINVNGVSWFWEFEYPDEGIRLTDELVVPVNQPIKLVMRSEDVLHSFFVPDFRIKKDVLPGRYTTTWFEATEIGESIVFCAEYCGTEHSTMDATIRVVSEEDFEAFLDEEAIDIEEIPLAELGELTFEQQGCMACHSTDGTPGAGPTLQGLYQSERTMDDGTTLTADEEYLRESIVDPRAQITEGYPANMPTFYGDRLSDREIDALITFIKELQ